MSLNKGVKLKEMQRRESQSGARIASVWKGFQIPDTSSIEDLHFIDNDNENKDQNRIWRWIGGFPFSLELFGSRIVRISGVNVGKWDNGGEMEGADLFL